MSEYIISDEQIAENRRLNGRMLLVMPVVVRCRDCAYIFHRKYNNGFEYQTCSYFDSEYAEVEPDGFCAWGERRSE